MFAKIQFRLNMSKKITSKRGLSSSKKVTLETEGIKNLDVMGEKFKFHYNRETKQFKTRIGGLTTILIAIISLTAMVMIFS